jgi:NTP pyrophosphatase (non-canonical NTP hydrolase)
MTLNDYQCKALETAVYPVNSKVIYPSLGLTGEAGEVADKVKKVIRDKGGDFLPFEVRLEIAKELGDVLWYCATLANDLGFTMEDIAQINVDKLQSRKQRGVLSGNGDNR